MPMPQPNSEKRVATGLSLEVRAEGDSKKIVGYAAVFNSPTDIGGFFREQIKPGAFAAAIARDDVRALIDHDSTLVLGRNKAGTLTLAEDEKGLRIEITPPDTQPSRDLMVSMERGDISGMSFGFRALKQEWDDTQDPPLRTIIEAELFDVSVVTYPAYADTEVALRSLESARAERKQNNSRAAARRVRMKMHLGLKSRRVG
jgi:HK97 family phage prohead protease